MNVLECIRFYLLLCCIAVFFQPLHGAAQENPGTSSAGQRLEHDGQHDFDFEYGVWKIHLKRRLHPLTGSTTWVEFDGTSVTRKVWEGRSQLEEFETDGGAGHIEGLTLRTYNPQAHQWSLYWANSKDGTVVPPQVGQFKNGLGEFYGQDTLNGKLIYIRFVWSKTDTNMPHFEQSFSEDGGKIWEVNWITDQTRVSDRSGKAEVEGSLRNAAQRDGQHGFDFSYGTWKTQIKRLQHPLAGSTTWVEYQGTSVVRKIWNGRASLGETEADGPAGHLEALSLRLYNPEARQWNLTYANGQSGTLSVASSGEFNNGRDEFYDTEPVNGRSILVRQAWSDITSSSCHFEQAFSEDGGKTWEVNWIATDTRVNDESDKTK